jgi:hypothetical protein
VACALDPSATNRSRHSGDVEDTGGLRPDEAHQRHIARCVAETVRERRRPGAPSRRSLERQHPSSSWHPVAAGRPPTQAMPSRSYLVKPWPNKAQTGEWCPSHSEHNDYVFHLVHETLQVASSRCEPARSIPTEHRERRRSALQGPAESASQPPEARGQVETVEHALDFSPYRRRAGR